MKWLNRDLIVGPYYGLCTDEKDFHRALKHLGIEKENWPEFITSGADATCHLFTTKASLACIVCLDLDAKVRLEQFISLLVHEATHIWQAFKSYINETNPSSEFEAYSIQRLSQSLIAEFLKKQKVWKITKSLPKK